MFGYEIRRVLTRIQQIQTHFCGVVGIDSAHPLQQDGDFLIVNTE